MNPATMRAAVFRQPGEPLRIEEVPVPRPGPRQVLLRVRACAVCRTDLHILDGDLPHPKTPLILGHEIVGTVARLGAEVTRWRLDDRVGVPWLGGTDGTCRYCQRGQENLCERAEFTGYTLDGGFAEYTVAHEDYCFPIPERYDDLEAAPLLCAGLIGYRTYRLAGEGVERLGIYGFGAAAHILAQVAVSQGKQVFAFTRPGDYEAQAFARQLGAVWAGGSDERPPEPLDAALIFAPVGSLVVAALEAVAPAGVVVCGGIHMSDIPSFPYRLLWEERVLRSVANLTRRDGQEFMALAAQIPIHTHVVPFRLDQAADALERLRNGQLEGAAVLDPRGEPASEPEWLPANTTVGADELNVGMDVLGSDGGLIGSIKEIRSNDFLVARPAQRDVYVPLTAVMRAGLNDQKVGLRRQVVLDVTSSGIDLTNWPTPPL
jgi:propanol-preferring alcohol dehydrogenase